MLTSASSEKRDTRPRLSEGVQDVHRIFQTGQVDPAVGAAVVPHAQFLNTGADLRHGFEVHGLLAALDFVELKTDVLSGVPRKIAQALQRVAEEAEWLPIEVMLKRKSYSTVSAHGWLRCECTAAQIGVHALWLGVALVSNNSWGFSHVPGLRLENWAR